MKKLIIIIVSFIALSTLFSSCKKDYVCECRKTYTRSNGTTISETDGLYTFSDTKPRAADRCTQQEGSGSDLSGSYVRDCELK